MNFRKAPIKERLDSVKEGESTCINCAHIMCLFHGEKRTPVFRGCWKDNKGWLLIRNGLYFSSSSTK